MLSPLWFNNHLRSPSSMPPQSEHQYEIAIIALTASLQDSNIIAEHVFSKSPNTFSPNHRTRFLQNRQKRFLQITEDFSPNLQDISPISEQHTFCSVLDGKDPVFDLSLHVSWAPRPALWVVGCGSLVTPIPPTRPWAPRSMLWTMGQPRPRVQHRIHCPNAAYVAFISKFV